MFIKVCIKLENLVHNRLILKFLHKFFQTFNTITIFFLWNYLKIGALRIFWAIKDGILIEPFAQKIVACLQRSTFISLPSFWLCCSQLICYKLYFILLLFFIEFYIFLWNSLLLTFIETILLTIKIIKQLREWN